MTTNQLNPRRVARLAFAALLLLSVLALAQDDSSPPGPEAAHMASFAVTDAPESFEIVTLVLDFAPGSVVPLHIHPGRGSNILLEGELVEVDENGEEHVLEPGEGWTEEQGRPHVVRNDSDELARLLFTVLVPEGEELTTYLE